MKNKDNLTINFAITIFFLIRLLLEFTQLIVTFYLVINLVAWIDSNCEKCTIDVHISYYWTYANALKKQHNKIELYLYCIITLYLSHHGCELEFKLVARCTMWIWTWAHYHVHNVNLNLCLLFGQNVNYSSFFWVEIEAHENLAMINKRFLICRSTH